MRRGFREAMALADQMIVNMNMPKNAEKGHWRWYRKPRLCLLLAVELWELICALMVLARAEKNFRRTGKGPQWDALVLARTRVSQEGADVCVFVMMILDNSGALCGGGS